LKKEREVTELRQQVESLADVAGVHASLSAQVAKLRTDDAETAYIAQQFSELQMAKQIQELEQSLQASNTELERSNVAVGRMDAEMERLNAELSDLRTRYHSNVEKSNQLITQYDVLTNSMDLMGREAKESRENLEKVATKHSKLKEKYKRLIEQHQRLQQQLGIPIENRVSPFINAACFGDIC
jgi:chromosome segregation ATPase